MNQTDFTAMAYEMSLQALAMSKALKNFLVTPEQQEKFNKEYQLCLREIVKDNLSLISPEHIPEHLKILLQ
ncbi:MAG: hypothetical protein MJ009_00600 [Paludibacteraceae bacterium]|nr:hypothetical protein [Paludibacteraceae bacterium]